MLHFFANVKVGLSGRCSSPLIIPIVLNPKILPALAVA